MRDWFIPVILGALLLLVGAGLEAATAPDDPATVLAMPLEGDRASYTASSITTHPDGETTEWSGAWDQEWVLAEVPVPMGAPVERPTLRMTTAQAAGTNPLIGYQQSIHFSELPGTPEAIRSVFGTDADGRTTFEDAVFVWDGTSFVDRGCQQDPTGSLVGQSPEAALAALEACLAAQGSPSSSGFELRAGWEMHPDWGATWVVTLSRDGADASGAALHEVYTIRTSPAVSMPLEMTTTHETATPEGIRTTTYAARMVGYAPGQQPLATATDPLPRAPPIPITTWDAGGPATGDMATFPLRSTYEATRQDPRGDTYFQENPSARLAVAFYAEADVVLHPTAPARGFAQCEDRQLEPAAALVPSESGRASWTTYWGAPDENLAAFVQASRAPPPDALSLPLPHPTSPAQLWNPGQAAWFVGSTPPPTKGPSIQGLMEWVPTLEEKGATGLPVVIVYHPALGNIPWDESSALVGNVALADCSWDSATGEAVYREHGIYVFDGEPVVTYTRTEVGRASGLTPVTLLDAAPPQQEPAFDPVLPAGALGLAGLALVTGGIAFSPVTRVLPALYSRLTAKDLLDHPLRSRILEIVRDNPGIRLPELARELDSHRATVAYHLRRLESTDFIVQSRSAHGIVIHPTGDPEAEHAHVLARTGAKELLALIQADPGLSVTELADELERPKSRISELTQVMEEVGLIERIKDGRTVRMYPA